MTHSITRRDFLKKGAALGLGIAALYTLEGCAPGVSKPKAPQKITIAQGADAATMDPQNHGITLTANVVSHVYDSLGQRNPAKKYAYEGRLAESWEIVDDLTIDLKLRKGVTFSNGEPFNAEVCKYNLDRIMGKLSGVEPPFAAQSYSKLTEAQALDEYTVRVATSEIDVFLLQRVLDLEMVPKEYTEEHGFEISRWNSFVINESTGETNREGVYAGGDDVTGPATVIEAIQAAHIAAKSMKEFLK